MNLPDLETEKKYKIFLLLFLIYFIGVVIYFSLGNYYKNSCFVPDEGYYILAAKAFSNGDGLYYNGVKSTFQKIVYSIVISPAFLVKNLSVQIKLICLLGALFEVSFVFPIYLICRKLSLSRSKSLLFCFFSLSFPTLLFSITFMSETAFLPLWLWVVYLVILFLERDDFNFVAAIFLGLLAYILYMCKEVGIVAIPALCLTKAIFIVKNKKSFKVIVSCMLSIIIFAVLFFLCKFLFFDGSGSYYSYNVTVPQAPESSDKNPFYYIAYASLFYLGYIILTNFIFPTFIRAPKDSLNQKLSIFIEISILALIFIIVYRLLLYENYGMMSPRLHLRYIEPLFIPYTICFIARLDDLKEENVLGHKYAKLVFGIYLVVLMILPGLENDGLLDAPSATIYYFPRKIANMFFLGSPRKTVIMNIEMKFAILIITLLGLYFLKKNTKKFFAIFLVTAFILNIGSICIKYPEIRKGYELSGEYVEEMQVINDELDILSGKKLIISRSVIRLSEIITTYYNIEDTDISFTEDDYSVLDTDVFLKAAESNRVANKDEYDYIVYEKGIWENTDEDSLPLEKVLLTTDNFYVVDNR